MITRGLGKRLVGHELAMILPAAKDGGMKRDERAQTPESALLGRTVIHVFR